MDWTGVHTLIQAAGYATDAQSVAAQDEAIKATLLELAGEREWSWLQARKTTDVLTPGSEIVPLPTDLTVPKSLDLRSASANFQLQEVDASILQRRLDADFPTYSGVPAEWAWVRRTILVWPRPDQAYTVRLDYIKVPDVTAFDATTEVPPFELRFHPVLAWGAIRWLAFRQRQDAQYKIASDEYKEAKRNFVWADRRGEPTHVVDWDGWNALPDDTGPFITGAS